MKQEILDKAIDRAKKNGWQHPYHPDVEYCFELIFNHDFAKALWGELTYYPYENQPGCPMDCEYCYNKLKVWEYHLQQLAISEDPIKYLGDN